MSVFFASFTYVAASHAALSRNDAPSGEQTSVASSIVTDLAANGTTAIPMSRGHENAAVAVIHDAASVVAGTATAAPEPSTLLLLGCGLLGVGGVVRRRMVVRNGTPTKKRSRSDKPSINGLEEQA